MKSILFIATLAITFALTKNINSTLSRYNISVDTIKKELRDPVCRMKINPRSKTTINYMHDKVNYSFCAEVCKKQFVANPAKYLKKK